MRATCELGARDAFSFLCTWNGIDIHDKTRLPSSHPITDPKSPQKAARGSKLSFACTLLLLACRIMDTETLRAWRLFPLGRPY
jgi:hypothetical protein